MSGNTASEDQRSGDMCICGCRKGGSRSNNNRSSYDVSSDLRMNDILKIMNEQMMENDSDSESKSSTGAVNVNVTVNSVGSENVLANDSSAKNTNKDELDVKSESESENTNKPVIEEGDIKVISETESEAESDSKSKSKADSDSKAKALIEDKSVVDIGGESDDDGDNGNGGDKVTICHNGQTLEVAQSAVQAHLDHGDTLGACEE